MNKRLLFIGIAVVFILGGGLIFLIQGQGDGAASGYKSSDWYSKYEFDSKAPYGLYYFNMLLQKSVTKSKIQHVSNENRLDTLLKSNQRTLYVMIGDTVTLNASQFQNIITRVKQGDGLMLFANKTYQWVYDSLNLAGNISYAYDRVIPLKTRNRTYNLYHLYQADTIAARTFGMQPCNKPVLSSNNGLVVETTFPVGNGQVLIGFYPKAIVNYQLLSPAGEAHAEFLISKLTSYDRVLFLSYATLKWQTAYNWEDSVQEEKDSLLKLINEHPALKHATFALLVGLILFAFFAGKRKRAIIPLPDAPSKLTATYIQTISSIYQSHESPSVAFNLVKQQFFHAIHRAFYTDLTKLSIEDKLRVLKEKTGLENQIIQETLNLISAPGDQIDMAHVYLTARNTHNFLSKAGIIKTLENPKQFPIVVNRNATVSFFVFMIGVIFVFFGFYSAAQSNPIGPGIAVIGGILIGLGILRFRTPLIRIEDSETTDYMPLLGQRVPCIISYNEQHNELEFYSTKAHRILSIPRWDTSRFAYSELVTYIKQKHHGRTTTNG
jgi:hypothetical protein